MSRWLMRALAVVVALFSSGAHAQTVVVLPGLVNAAPAQPGNPTPTLNAPWSQCDVGSAPAAGSATNSTGSMQLTGAGDLGSNNNNNVMVGHRVYQPWTGDVDVVAQVQAITGSFDWRQSGIVLSQAACANTAPWVAVTASVELQFSAQQGVGFHLDGTVNGRATSYSTGISGALPPPVWLRLARNGAVVSAYYGSSQTGPWTQFDSETRAFSGTFYIGLHCASGDVVSTSLAGCSLSEPIITSPSASPGTLSYSKATQTVTEGATFTPCVNRSGGTTGAVSVHVHDAGTGTATGSDWTTSDLDQVLSWADGDGAQKCVANPVHTTNRAGDHGDRTINLSFTTFTGGATVGAQATQVVTIIDAITLTAQKKWHPGYFAECCFNSTDMNDAASRQAKMDYWQQFPQFQGMYLFYRWVDIEPTMGNYSGIDKIKADIAHAKNEPHPMRFIISLVDEPNSGICHGQQCQWNWYPQYMQDAGCLMSEQFQNANDYNTNFTWWQDYCVNRAIALINALGAALDSEPYLEVVQLTYEIGSQPSSICVLNCNTWTSTAHYEANILSYMTAAAAAFPHTNLKWQANWGIKGVDDNLVTLLGYAKSLGIGWGSQDACSIDPVTFQNVYGTYPIYQDAQNIFAGYGGYSTNHQSGLYTDQRGKMFSMDGVETSELGYNVVCNGQGFAGYATVANGLRAAGYMDLYSEWNAEWNSHPHVTDNTYAGTAVQQWAVGVTGSLWDLVVNHPVVHTACPTDYDALFGNGTPGSGCNTQ